MPDSYSSVEEQLQVLDVQIVDVLAHLEALLRHSHSIQRALLQMRHAAPPPRPAPTGALLGPLHNRARDMGRECEMLSQIVDDLARGIETVGRTVDGGAQEASK
jgi:hypothetical protein